MEKMIERVLMRKYPELKSGWHLPMWAKVTDILTPLAGEKVTEEVPVYSVSVQLLKANGAEDKDIPVMEDVLLPVSAGGEQRGFWSKPSVGTMVEIAFAYGSPAHPFIRSILPHGLKLPNMAETDQRWQQSEKAYTQVSKDDEWETKGKNSTTEIEEDLRFKAGQLSEIIANKHHTGDDSTNIYGLLHDLMNTVADLAKIAGTHNHSYTWTDPSGAGATSPPMQTSSYTQKSAEATEQAGKLQPLLK
ncbi:hypothetical protein [Marinomonas transparens]|uniref:Uncharacterized protein n=1 Tax=Marinomonas transparens TaxID=2795388 RepID=A0A934JIZ0_9GAMM|nr:hypothetical protein [Marinomonas transparens]MBJ7536940.1 hypothetical protein [Marinomonas transparens]